MAESISSSSSGSPAVAGDASSPRTSESAASSASILEKIQNPVLQSTDFAIQSAPTKQHKSSTAHIRTIQNFLPEAVSHYRTYEDAFINKVKDGLLVAREQPAASVGFAITAALLVMRGPRRFLFRQTLGRLQSEEARYARAEKNVKDLNLSVELMRKESKKLLERTDFAEKDMNYGYNELMITGTQFRQFAKSLYKVEAQAGDLMDRLREIPSREALALRAEVASMQSILKRQRSAVDKRIVKISELGIAV